MALLILHQIPVQAARGAVRKRTTIVHCSLAIGHGRNRWPLQKSSAWALGGLSVFKLFCHRIGSAALSQCPRIGYLKIRTLSRDNLGQVKLSLGYVRIKNLSHRPWMCATPWLQRQIAWHNGSCSRRRPHFACLFSRMLRLSFKFIFNYSHAGHGYAEPELSALMALNLVRAASARDSDSEAHWACPPPPGQQRPRPELTELTGSPQQSLPAAPRRQKSGHHASDQRPSLSLPGPAPHRPFRVKFLL